MRQLNLFGETEKQDSKEKEISHKAKSYTGLYALHKYWGKKPYNIMQDFIKKYTNPNEIVLDPFLGSGVSITEAVFNERKGFGIDINPSAIFITEQLLKKIDPDKIREEYNSIEYDIRKEIDSFYSIVREGKSYIGQNFLWENNELTEIRYTKGNRKRFFTEPKEEDKAKANGFDLDQLEYFYPTSNFFHNSRINAKGNQNVSNLFTKRNLFALSVLYNRIQNIEDDNLKNLFKFCFTSALGQASKMVFVIKRRNKTKGNGSTETSQKKEIGSWVIGYWQPKEFFENNVWTCFETRFKKLLKAKKQQYNIPIKYAKSNNFNELIDSKDYLLVTAPSQKYLKNIPNNSIDYILTDPPHSNRIPYLELSLLWNSWLKKNVDYDDEIVLSESKERKKDITDYNTLLKEVIKESYRVLKPEKHLSIMFNSLDDAVWINLIKAFLEIGFEFHQIETLGYSANSVVQDNRKNGLQTDFIITFKKPFNENNRRNLIVSELDKNPNLVENIRELKHSGYKSFQIINNTFCNSLKENKFFKISEIIKTIENA